MSRPQFDPSAYAAQLEDKKSRLAGLLAPFAAPAPEVFESPREHCLLYTSQDAYQVVGLTRSGQASVLVEYPGR